MSIALEVIEDLSDSSQEFKAFEIGDNAECIAALALEYRNLRTECSASLNSVNVEGIGIFDTTRIRSILASRVIPERQDGPFDVVRSDMGETLSYILLEQNYNTKIGYKSIRDRELVQQPGRGIDIVGVENNGNLTLILGEVKVSNEDRNPPRVVDSNEDSISNSLIGHIQNHEETSNKLWDVARRTQDPEVSTLLFTAAIYYDEKDWTNLHVICCGVLVRPRNKYNNSDFGLLIAEPDRVAPAKMRFLIACINCELDDFVSEFHQVAILDGGAS